MKELGFHEVPILIVDEIDKSCSHAIYKNILFSKFPVRFVVITCGDDSFDFPIFGAFIFLREVPHFQPSLIGKCHEIVCPGVWAVPYPVIFRVCHVTLRPKFTFLKNVSLQRKKELTHYKVYSQTCSHQAPKPNTPRSIVQTNG